MQVDPKISFWLGIITTIALLIGQGTLGLTDAIPADWIPVVKAWNNIVGTVGTTAMTALAGVASAQHGPAPLTKMLTKMGAAP